MSYTEIYKFNKDGNAEFLAEVHNAWRGARAVWSILEDKYLPPYAPPMAELYPEGYKRVYSMKEDAMKEIWDLYENPRISEVDKIVLISTFDNMTVQVKDVDKLLDAFERFEGDTSLKEQAQIIRGAISKDKDIIAIAWNQTSVCGDTWNNFCGYDKDDEPIPYNILEMKEHNNLFDYI